MKIIDFIKLKYWDWKNPPAQHPNGILVFCADKGAGKTVSAVEYLKRQKEENGYTVASNINIVFQDKKIKTFEDILALPDDSIIFLDESNLVFNSRDWKDRDKRLLYILTQSRHIHKQLVLACQSFGHIDIELRDFCTEVIKVHNWANRWFYQTAFAREDYKRVLESNIVEGVLTEQQENWINNRVIWRYDFIADNNLFAQYDSYDRELINPNAAKFSLAGK